MRLGVVVLGLVILLVSLGFFLAYLQGDSCTGAPSVTNCQALVLGPQIVYMVIGAVTLGVGMFAENPDKITAEVIARMK